MGTVGARTATLGLTGGAAIVALFAGSGEARADEPAARIALEWSAPAGCSSAARVTAEVNRLLGDRAPRPATPLPITVNVSRDRRGAYQARLETQAREGTRVRELQGVSCAAVADAAALIIALMIDPSAVVVEPPSTSAPSPAPNPAPPASAPTPPPDTTASAPTTSAPTTGAPTASTPTAGVPTASAPTASAPTAGAPTASAPTTSAPAEAPPPFTSQPSPAPPPFTATAEPLASTRPSARTGDREPPSSRISTGDREPPSSRISFGLLTWGGADIGALPAIAAGFGATGSLLYGAQRFEAGITIWPERSARSAAFPKAGGDIGLMTGSLGACHRIALGPVRLGPCAALEMGRMSATGFGVDVTIDAEAFWAALTPGAMLAWSPGGNAELVVRADAAIPFSRPEFVIPGLGSIHRASAASARIAAGVDLPF